MSGQSGPRGPLERGGAEAARRRLVPAAPTVALVLGTTTGGTGAHVRSLAAGLAARGSDVTVFGPAATRFAAAGVSFTQVDIADRPRPAHDLATVATLRRMLRLPASGRPGPRFSVVHAHGVRAGAIAALGLGGLPRLTRRTLPVLVVTLHNAPPQAGGAAEVIYNILERIVARQADRVLCVSGDLASRMHRRGARSVGRAVVPAPAAPPVPPGTARAVRAELGAAERPLVLAVGRLAAQKGFAELLAAAARLGDLSPRPLVVIAGDGPLRAQLARQIDTERLPLTLLGHRTDIPALLAAADLFVLPSLWEGQPLILQEALRAGVPVVATRTGGIPDLTGDDGALLVPPGDPWRLAAAIRRVLTEPELAARLAAAAAERARSLPDEAAAVQAVLTEYRATLAGLHH